MRSSKSRSRSKQNRPRTVGNIVNRVFDSSGPEGKVRGTPQQIIEKYQALARDAQLSNDRVAAENFLQHAEHYTRMLGEAMRELAAEQDQRRQQHGGPGGNGNGNGNGYQPRRDTREDDQPDIGAVPVFAFDDPAEEDTGLVETPEARTEPPRAAQFQRHDRRDPPRREDQQRRDDQPRRDDQQRRDDQPRRDDQQRREDPPRRDDQQRREDPPRREDQPRRDDRKPREDRRPRGEQPARQPDPAPEPVAVQPAPAAVMAPTTAPAVPEAEPKARRPRSPRKPKDAAAPDTPPGTEAAE
jgi:hypothetical protein